MKIVHLFQFTPWIQARIYPVFLGLAELGHEMTAIVTHPSRMFGVTQREEKGYTIIEVPSFYPGRLRNGWCLYDTLLRINELRQMGCSFDIAHGFDHRPNVVFPLIYLQKKCPDICILTDWNDWWGRGGLVVENRPFGWAQTFGHIETYFEENFRKRFDGVTTISTALRERAVKLGIPEEKVEYIRGAALSSHFKPVDRLENRKRFNLPDDKIILGWTGFGRLGVDLMFRTLKVLDSKGIDYAFLYTGKTNPDWKKFKPQLDERKIFNFGIIDWDTLPYLLSCVDIFLLPFPYKTANLGKWPNKLGDYISLGRPYITNPTGDVKTFTEKNGCGILVDENPESFANAIMYLIDNEDVRKKMGEKGRHASENDISPVAIARDLEAFYSRIMNMKKGIS
ncbi:MAG: glycosyltransferase [Candidatus Coatesbacteria bacterium]|nr:glycosyltransferase [Candidatus Coatesbacteria bacterium]